MDQNQDQRPVILIRDLRTGHDQNKQHLKKDIRIGFSQFSPIVEIIRLLKLDEFEPNVKLLQDFLKFRDIVAHKQAENIILIQMLCAFVIYCRKLMGFSKVSHQPASTKEMSKKFARMADINVLQCSEWFLSLLDQNKVTKENVVRWMNKVVQKSSYYGYTFSIFEDDIVVVNNDGVESFYYDWFNEHEKNIMSMTINYSDDEENAFKNIYETAKKML